VTYLWAGVAKGAPGSSLARPAPDGDEVRTVAPRLSEARSPVILAGGGWATRATTRPSCTATGATAIRARS
jgi:thiamine pyrophosphate-dependent acetolactate synthase large subunit-like protein